MAQSKLRFRLAATVLSLAAFPLLEIGLRCGGFWYPPADQPLSIWNPAEDRAMRFGTSMFTTAPRQLWVPRPGARVVWGDDERINAAGYRGTLRKPERSPGVLRILVLGESCTFGYGVGHAETFPDRLEALLRERGRDAEVINGGVIGYTVRQGLERYRAFGRAYRPDIVVSAFGEVNEHFVAVGSPDVEKVEAKLEEGSVWAEIVQLVRMRVRAVHLVASLLDRMTAERTLQRDLRFRKASHEHEMQLHMGEIDWKGQRRVPLDDFEAATLALARDVKADGARFVIFSLPRRRDAEQAAPVLPLYTQVLEEISRRDGIPLADGHGAFRRAEENGVKEDDLFRDTWHLTRAGHETLARELADRIEALADPR